MCCRETGQFIAGIFAEPSVLVSSYSGEHQLGFPTIYLLLHTFELLHGCVGATNDVFCNNKGIITAFSLEAKRVPSGKKNTDIARTLR